MSSFGVVNASKRILWSLALVLFVLISCVLLYQMDSFAIEYDLIGLGPTGADNTSKAWVINQHRQIVGKINDCVAIWDNDTMLTITEHGYQYPQKSNRVNF